MTFIKTFTQISKDDVPIAGGKGASLGEMTQAGFLVPPGFVILASAFDRFLLENEIDADLEAILKKVNHKDINSVDKASAEIRDLIHDEKMPKDLRKEILDAYRQLFTPPSPSPSASARHRRDGSRGRKNKEPVAVRSSATAEDSKVASWAGELETYLNVTQKNLIKSVKKCWSSLFTPRAIFYRFEKKLHKQKVSVAVIVQKMVQSQVSGICFTVHPVTKDRNQLVIEAGFGLGEAIVGGLITPDTYIIHKNNFSLLDLNVSRQSFAIVKTKKSNSRQKLSATDGGKQKLIKRQIVHLAKICKKIEQHYHHPQDIEWALQKGKFYITQSRPITTL